VNRVLTLFFCCKIFPVPCQLMAAIDISEFSTPLQTNTAGCWQHNTQPIMRRDIKSKWVNTKCQSIMSLENEPLIAAGQAELVQHFPCRAWWLRFTNRHLNIHREHTEPSEPNVPEKPEGRLCPINSKESTKNILKFTISQSLYPSTWAYWRSDCCRRTCSSHRHIIQ
jgi:hypothetical protein